MGGLRVAVADLQFIGQDLARPECVAATASGDVYVSDKRGGITHLMPDGRQTFLAGQDVDGFLPNGFSPLPDRSFAVADIGHLGGAWRLMPDGELNAAELLGQILRSGMSRSTTDRLRHALGPQGLGQADGPLGAWFGEATGEGESGDGIPGGLAESAQEFIGADHSSRGGNPLAAGGVAALAGALLGGSGGALKGALGGATALLGGLALSALGRAQQTPGAAQPAHERPLGLRPAQDAAETERLDQTATLILTAMINAAKADGQVDQEELQRIVGKLRKAGAGAEALQFVMTELRKPMDLEELIRDVPDRQVAVQLYAASLLAIEVDTEAERQYLRRLAHGLGLDASVVRRVHQCLGMEHA